MSVKKLKNDNRLLLERQWKSLNLRVNQDIEVAFDVLVTDTDAGGGTICTRFTRPCRVIKVWKRSIHVKVVLISLETLRTRLSMFAFDDKVTDPSRIVSKFLYFPPPHFQFEAGDKVEVYRGYEWYESMIVLSAIGLVIHQPDDRLVMMDVTMTQMKLLRLSRWKEMHKKCRAATLCFMWLWRRICGNPRDLSTLIGKRHVWPTRDNRMWL